MTKTAQYFALSLWIFILSFNHSHAQQIWSLEDCLKQGIHHSKDIKQAQLRIAHQDIAFEQQKRSRDPKLYANTQMGWQFGRNIDPTTNSFNNEGIFFQSATIQGSFSLYQGGRIAYEKQQQKANSEAAMADAQQVEFQLKLNVTNAYLQVLLAKEKWVLAQKTLNKSQEQSDRIFKDIAIGVRPQRDLVNMEAQIAQEKRQLTNTEYQLQEAYRSLKHLIGLAVEATIEVKNTLDQDWENAINTSNFNLSDNALETFPAFKAAKARLRALDAEQNGIIASQKPAVELFGSIGTQFSSAAQTINGYNEQLVDQQVWLEGQPNTLSVVQKIPNYENNPYSRQVKNNFGQSLGIRATWPIWNGKANNFARQQASVRKLEAELAIAKEAEWFNYELDKSIRYLKASQTSYTLAEQSVETAQKAYDMTVATFAAGGTSAYELLDVKQRLNMAQASLIEARYDCLFAYKIVQTLLL